MSFNLGLYIYIFIALLIGFVTGSWAPHVDWEIFNVTFHKRLGEQKKSKAKKQHQAGWGEGDDGEDRLGQFFRLKDGDFARTQMRSLPYGKVTHGENTWKTWTTHGKHMENTSRQHMEKTHGKHMKND